VEQTAVELAKHHNLDVEKRELRVNARSAKYFKPPQLLEMARAEGLRSGE